MLLVFYGMKYPAV